MGLKMHEAFHGPTAPLRSRSEDGYRVGTNGPFRRTQTRAPDSLLRTLLTNSRPNHFTSPNWYGLLSIGHFTSIKPAVASFGLGKLKFSNVFRGG
jgi:hypothetical protein